MPGVREQKAFPGLVLLRPSCYFHFLATKPYWNSANHYLSSHKAVSVNMTHPLRFIRFQVDLNCDWVAMPQRSIDREQASPKSYHLAALSSDD